MMQLDRITLGRMAKELGFVRDTFDFCSEEDSVSTYAKINPIVLFAHATRKIVTRLITHIAINIKKIFFISVGLSFL